MSAPAFMPFYVGDYLRDTMHLTTEEHGAYLLLIFSCWTNNGKFPNDDKLLASITKTDMAKWILLRGKLKKFFKVSARMWTQKRIDFELGKADHIPQVRKNAGKNGAAKRWQKPSQKHSSRARDSTATATIEETPTINEPAATQEANDDGHRHD